MKYLLFVCLLGLAFTTSAQFVVGNATLVIQKGTTLTVDGLVLKPTADVSIQNNEFQRNPAKTPVGSGHSIGRVYSFTNPVNYSGTVGFSYDNSELDGKPENNLSLFYSSLSEGNNWHQGVNGFVDDATNYVSASVSSGSLWRLTAGQATALPVTLIEFTVRKHEAGKAAILTWKVANETDFKAYIVERSADAKAFSALASVPATGSSIYSCQDLSPMEGTNYYRLKMIDKDESYAYSHIRGVVFLIADHLVIFPNPIPEKLYLKNILLTNILNVSVYDINGRKHFDGAFKPDDGLNVKHLSPGTYVLKITEPNGQQISLKFIKQ